MSSTSYEGPSNGDYVAYVDKLLRASPDFRSVHMSVTGAFIQAGNTPGMQSDSPLARMREKVQQARDTALAAQKYKAVTTIPAASQQARTAQAQSRAATIQLNSAATPTRHAASMNTTTNAGRSKADAKRRFEEIEREIEGKKAEAATTKTRPWITPFMVIMIVAGAVMTQFAPSVGAVISLMGWISLIGNVLSKVKGK